MKIALSASYFDHPAVRLVLEGCDFIYTTQHNNLPVLQNMFGKDKVRPLPFNTPDLMGFIQAYHEKSCMQDEQIEYINFTQLSDAKRAYDKNVAQPTIDRDAERFQYLVDNAEYVPPSGLLPGHHRIVLDIPNGRGVREFIDQLVKENKPSKLPARQVIMSGGIPASCFPPSC